MPWVSLDDQFPIHRKVARLSDPAFRLHVAAICWANRNLTDGAIPSAELPLIAPGVRRRERLATELVDAGLWLETNPHGWVINDYLEYQPSKTTVKAMRDAKQSGGSLGAHRRWHEKRGITDPDCEHCAGG